MCYRTVMQVAVFSWMGYSAQSNAYELATHGAITFNAFGSSVLSGSYLKEGLGIENSADVFGLSYFELVNGAAELRSQDGFEKDVMEIDLKLIAKSLSIEGWLMRGAIREDDYRHDDFPCTITAPNPQDGVNVDRPVNHFYDPINDQSLGVGSAKAFDWALGTQNALTEAGNVPDTGRANHYTLFDAREAMFRALGDLVHLVEDMAQPQHTRVDAHLTECPDVVWAILRGKSLYEIKAVPLATA